MATATLRALSNAQLRARILSTYRRERTRQGTANALRIPARTLDRIVADLAIEDELAAIRNNVT